MNWAHPSASHGAEEGRRDSQAWRGLGGFQGGWLTLNLAQKTGCNADGWRRSESHRENTSKHAAGSWMEYCPGAQIFLHLWEEWENFGQISSSFCPTCISPAIKWKSDLPLPPPPSRDTEGVKGLRVKLWPGGSGGLSLKQVYNSKLNHHYCFCSWFLLALLSNIPLRSLLVQSWLAQLALCIVPHVTGKGRQNPGPSKFSPTTPAVPEVSYSGSLLPISRWWGLAL